MRLRHVLAIAAALALLTAAAPAYAIPALAFVPLLVSGGIVGATAVTISAVAALIVNVGLLIGVSSLVNKVFSPKQNQTLQERQASVAQLSLGEAPRELIVGRAVTGGQLMDAFNYGGTYGTDWEVLVIKLADHLCDALEGFYVNDVFVAYGGDGVVSGYNSQLEVYWRQGTLSQSPPSLLTTYGGWSSNDRMAGCSFAVVAYKIDAPNATSPTWTGRPQFKWRLRGKRFYDPRLDSTVAGGSGSHRYATPSTWAWTRNARICRYGWVRGIFAGDQTSSPQHLLIGRGLSSLLAPEVNEFAAANVCDEAVPLLAGGTEARYCVDGVIRASDDFRATEQMFADAMAGIIVQHAGGVEVEPGQNKSAVFTITDDDLVGGAALSFDDFLTDNARINSVIPRYVEPAQLWQDHAAPVRRVLGDITADGGPRETTLSLALVTSGTQAQRCAEIARRRARLERTATITLGPRFAAIEEGDWISWTSASNTQGAAHLYEVGQWALDAQWRMTVQLREVASNIATWVAATDEAVPGAGLPPGLSTPGALVLASPALASATLNGVPALKFTWTAPVDSAITSIRIEARVQGTTDVASVSTVDVNSGAVTFTNGVAAGTGVTMEARAIPLGDSGRAFTPTSWLNTASTGMVATTIVGQGSYATKNITAGSSAPGSPNTGDFWINTGITPNAMLRWTGSAWVAVHGKISQGPTAPSGPVSGDLWMDTSVSPQILRQYDQSSALWVSAGIEGQSAWATYLTVAPGVNHVAGKAATRDVAAPLSSASSTSIAVAAHTLYFPQGNVITPGNATLTGLSADTMYNLFLDVGASTYSAVSGTASGQFGSAAQYVNIGLQTTQKAGGGFTAATTAPGGGGGALSNWNPYAGYYLP